MTTPTPSRARFQSLYPSIIQEYNICYTTVKRHFTEEDEGSSIELPPPISHDEDFAVLPAVIARIVQSRREVKGLMGRENNPGRKKQYDLRQLALKLTANSMYGCLGFAQSRFFAEPIAALITSQGRKILQHTVDIAFRQVRLGRHLRRHRFHHGEHEIAQSRRIQVARRETHSFRQQRVS